MWLLKKRRPDHQTMADFRKNNLKPIRQVCREFTWLCKQLDLFSGELVAIDGSKFKAVNAKECHCTRDKLQRLLGQINQRVEDYLSELDRRDNQDAGTPGGATAENLQAKIEALQQRKLI
jgi:transposase